MFSPLRQGDSWGPTKRRVCSSPDQESRSVCVFVPGRRGRAFARESPHMIVFSVDKTRSTTTTFS